MFICFVIGELVILIIIMPAKTFYTYTIQGIQAYRHCFLF